MFGRAIEEDYLNAISQARAAERGGGVWRLLLLVALGIALLLAWAAVYEIEEVTTGTGRVVPSGKVQVVQTLEGGILRELAVAEGDVVERGAVLMRIDDTGVSSTLGEVRETKDALLAERARLLAEANGEEALAFAPELERAAPGAVRAEREVFASRREQLARELEVLADRLAQREGRIAELAATRAKLSAQIEPLEREVALTRRLVGRKVVPEIELLRLRSQLAALKGELAVVEASGPKAEAALREARGQIETARSSYRLAARERLAKLEAELAVVEETMRGASDRVTRTALRAPVRGVVNKVNVASIGAVLPAGRDLIEIVPLDEGLLIEAEIRPQDVAFIRPDEEASVKLTAYDYLVYGALRGRVARIGADTVENREGESFFKVVVRTEANHLSRGDVRYPIIPGMVAVVDIQTGRKSVLSYLMKPVLRARSEALRER